MAPLLLVLLAAAEIGPFRAQEIVRDWGVVYAVQTADINQDGKPDIVAITGTQVAWFENPTWRRHVILDGVTEKDNVSFAVHDIDGDGKPDLALAAGWQPPQTEKGGTLQWLRNPGTDQPWALTPIGEEPTLHRIRFADVDGDKRPELIALPLHGRGAKGPGWDQVTVKVLVFRIPADPVKAEWPMEIADDTLHIAHNFTTLDWYGDGRQNLLIASREGITRMENIPPGAWKKELIGAGTPGEIKVGLVNRQRVIATVDPWHGNAFRVYEEPRPPFTPQEGPPKDRAEAGKPYPSRVLDEAIASGHALGWADFDGDGSEELAAGWREKGGGVAIYKRLRSGEWTKAAMVDAKNMACEDLAIADLNGDGRPEIIGGGRATRNVIIYWNEHRPRWIRHELWSGDRQVLTAVAAPFTKGKTSDVIAALREEIVLFSQGRQQTIARGIDTIHSAVMDVDGDGDLDYIGARYSPGYVYWLENGAEWKLHVIDDSAKGGVDGIHGLVAGDVDGDGRLELIANSAQPKGAFANSIVWFKPGKDPRAPWERYVFAKGDAPGLSHYHTLGDLNGDGRPDIASAAKAGREGNWFAWWEQPKDPRKTWKRWLMAVKQEGATNVLIGDFNGDKLNDFVGARGHGVGITLWAAPRWEELRVDAEIAGPHALAAGDIDGDGDLDIVTCAKDSRAAVWYENDGRGGFTAHAIWEDQAAYDVRLVDLDGDGDLDLLVAGQQSKNVVWFENRVK